MSLSAGQLSLIRTEPQISRPNLALFQPATVFACQVNDTFATSDMVVEFEFDNVTTGAYTDVLPGQIVFVGSTPGAYDIGIGRARKAFGASTAYVGEVSDIAFDDDLYITVIDAMELNPKHIVVTSSSILMDVDIAYSDQHENFSPVPIMGGHVVVDTESYPVTVTFPKVADSWVFDSTISAYAFTATDGSVSDGTTSSPSLTISSYPTNGYIRVALQVTAANGASHTGYRYVLVYDSDHRPIEDFELLSCSASRSDGGWSARLKLNDEDDIALLRPGALAILYSNDYFNNVKGNVGLYADRENIWLSGWIYQYTRDNDPEHEPGEFEIQNAAFWMSQMPGFATGVELTTSTPTLWTEIEALTVDKALFHFFRWRSTVMEVMDVYLTDDTRYTLEAISAAGSLWSQITEIANAQVLAEATCNYNGMLAVRIPYNLTPSADRAAASTKVMDLTTADYSKNTKVPYVAPQAAMVVLNGISVDVYGNGTAIFSLAPGHVPARLGGFTSSPNLLLEDQDQANILAGLKLADMRNPYPDIPITLKGHNRAFDICPTLYGTIAGLSSYTGTIIPNEIDYTFTDGKLEVSISFSGETDESSANYVDGDIPDGEGGFSPIPGGYNNYEIPDLPPLPDIEFPTTIPVTVTNDCGDYSKNAFPLVWSKPFLDGSDSNKLISKAYFPCKIRSNPYTPTYIDFSVQIVGDAATHFNVYAVSGGTRVLTANLTYSEFSLYTFRANFPVLSDTSVDGFEIELEYGGWVGGPATITSFGDFACVSTQVNAYTISVQETTTGGNYATNISASGACTLHIWVPAGTYRIAFSGASTGLTDVVWKYNYDGSDHTCLDTTPWAWDGTYNNPPFNTNPWYKRVMSRWTELYSYAMSGVDGSRLTAQRISSGLAISEYDFGQPYYVIAGELDPSARSMYIYSSTLNNVCAP